MVYLRWRARGNWVVESLGITCRTASGRLIKAQCEAALRSARAKSDELLAQTAPSAPVAPRSALTLADTHAVVFDAATGRWRAEAARLRAIVRAESAPDDAAA